MKGKGKTEFPWCPMSVVWLCPHLTSRQAPSPEKRAFLKGIQQVSLLKKVMSEQPPSFLPSGSHSAYKVGSLSCSCCAQAEA